MAAFNRDANPSMNSPVNAFMTDVVGYDNVVNKKASKVQRRHRVRQQADDQADAG